MDLTPEIERQLCALERNAPIAEIAALFPPDEDLVRTFAFLLMDLVDMVPAEKREAALQKVRVIDLWRQVTLYRINQAINMQQAMRLALFFSQTSPTVQ